MNIDISLQAESVGRNMHIQLLPCKECGGIPKALNPIHGWYCIQCQKCNIVVHDPMRMDFKPLAKELRASRQRAVKAWNDNAGYVSPSSYSS